MRLVDADKLHYVHMLVQNPNTGKHKHIVAVRANEINSAPIVDVQPVIHAKWIEGHQYHYYNDGDIEKAELQCEHCGEIVEWDIELPHKPYFCENCGAKMDKEK